MKFRFEVLRLACKVHYEHSLSSTEKQRQYIFWYSLVQRNWQVKDPTAEIHRLQEVHLMIRKKNIACETILKYAINF